MDASTASRVVAPALLLLLAAGCAGETGILEPAPESSNAATTAGATEPEPSPTPEQPTAADGTDYAACGDGSCEVAVSEPVDIGLDGFALQVTAVTEDGVDITAERGGGTTSAGISGGYCVAFLTENGVQSGCYGAFVGDERPPVPEAEAGVLIVELLDFTAGTAIVRITSL